MANKAFGIITSAGGNFHVEGLHDYRPIGAFSFLGRYRVIDFPISNMSNSGIDQIQVYVSSRPRSIAEHIGTGRHYNINSKRGKIQLLFTQINNPMSVYNNNIAGFIENMEIIERMHLPYVVIAPSYMIYKQDYSKILDEHVESGADVTLLYHKVSDARDAYIGCSVLNLNKQKGVLSITPNMGTAKEKNIFMDTYVMSKEIFMDLVQQARAQSSAYTLSDIVSAKCEELDVRGVSHRGTFASITSLNDYYNANLSLLDLDKANDLFRSNWPIYTRTTNACPTQYFDTADVKKSMIANGCLIEGKVENSIIGRDVHIRKGAVVRDSIVLAYSDIGEGVKIDKTVVDKWAKITNGNEIKGTLNHPGYVKRNDKI